MRLHRQVHTVLNMWNYDLARKVLVAEAWCPASLSEATAAALRRASARSRAHAPSIVNVIETDVTPPTHFKLNKFTASFQAHEPREGERALRKLPV